MSETTQFELSKEFLDRFQQAVDERDATFIQETLQDIKSADISALLDEFDSEESQYVLELLGDKTAAGIINDLDRDTRKRFLKEYPPPDIAAIIRHLDSDDAADILYDLPLKMREGALRAIDDAEKEAHILDLLRYEEDVAGGLMAKELIKANLNWTVVRCIEEIRRQAENVEKIYSVYVVDDFGRLLGRVSLKKIILAEDNTRVANIYDDEVISVETFMEEREVAAIMRKYDLDAVPVVNVQGKLVGRITIDDIVDVITELAEEERQLMSGISEDVEEDDSVWRLTRARLPWLVIGIAGGLVSALFMGQFEEDLARITAIAFFIPLIQATGGNVGIQSSSIVVQSLANPSAFHESIWKRMFKVFQVAVLNGLILSLLVFWFNIATGGRQSLSFIVSVALFTVILISSFIGTLTPLILDKFGINPALASGPFITTTNDIIGLAVYFYTIHLLL